MVGRLWLCRPCYKGMRKMAEPATVPPPTASLPEGTSARLIDREAPRAGSGLEKLRQVDTTIRWGIIGIKAAFYLVCLILAPRDPFFAALLLGVFVGDSIAWVIQAWFDAQFHGTAVSAEAVIYTILFFILWKNGTFALPHEIGQRYLAGGAACLTLMLKGVKFWAKLHVHHA